MISLRSRYILWTLIVVLTALAVHVSAYDERALIDLARSAVCAEVEGKSLPTPSTKTTVHPVFVTIETKGRVIGCRGDLQARGRTLEDEVIISARAAAKHDPRYRPLTTKDLSDVQVTVTIVDHIQPLDHITDLTPAEGLVLKSGSHIGIVLPWEGKDPSIRLQRAYKKAGVAPGSACQLHRLAAERFRG